jgi:branched-chain amino acid transport system substrate-binding protein
MRQISWWVPVLRGPVPDSAMIPVVRQQMGAVWGITSVTCMPVSEILDRANIAMITPGSTNPKVTDRGIKSVARVCAHDDLQAPAGAVWLISELKKEKIAAIDDGTTGPRGAADGFETKGKELGATVLRLVIHAGGKDFRPVLRIIPKDVDAIYASIWASEAAILVKQLRNAGMTVPVLGSDGLFERIAFIHASGGASDGDYVSFLVPDVSKVPSARAFAKAFEAKYGAVSSYGPLAYEATNILLTAIQKVGQPDRAGIRDAVRATKGYPGLLGNAVTFNDKGDVDTQNVYIYQVKGPNFVRVKAISLGG